MPLQIVGLSRSELGVRQLPLRLFQRRWHAAPRRGQSPRQRLQALTEAPEFQHIPRALVRAHIQGDNTNDQS